MRHFDPFQNFNHFQGYVNGFHGLRHITKNPELKQAQEAIDKLIRDIEQAEDIDPLIEGFLND